MCAACGAYTAKQVNNLCLPCPGRARATNGGVSRVNRFLKGLHPKDKGVSLGDAWLPPEAVVEALLSHQQSRETPAWPGVGPTGAPGNGQASLPAGSPEYRVAVLAAMGLDEADLALLVTERAKARGHHQEQV